MPASRTIVFGSANSMNMILAALIWSSTDNASALFNNWEPAVVIYK